jgi:methionyl-tRNA formyltransferase
LNVVFLTANDLLYLPAFFDRVLAEGKQRSHVFVVPPLYKGQSALGAGWRYARTFGFRSAWTLARRIVTAKIGGDSIASASRRNGVPCEAIPDVNAPAFLERLRSLDADLVVSVSCPQIFQNALLGLPPLGCVNVHGAILPNYRGVMPSFWMMLNDEQVAGVSAFFMNEDIDGGELCGQRIFRVERGQTLDAFLRRSKALAAELVLDVLREIEDGTVTRKPLDLADGSYFSWPDRKAVAEFRASGKRLW